jgi:hypothetical protein
MQPFITNGTSSAWEQLPLDSTASYLRSQPGLPGVQQQGPKKGKSGRLRLLVLRVRRARGPLFAPRRFPLNLFAGDANSASPARLPLHW